MIFEIIDYMTRERYVCALEDIDKIVATFSYDRKLTWDVNPSEVYINASWYIYDDGEQTGHIKRIE